jgi:glutathione S-transferase
MVTLYEHPLSPYVQKVKIALYEKAIPFEPVIPNIFGGDPGFDRTNPRREVPSLVDGETAVFDSSIILEYIEDKWPNARLLPATPAERARVRMLEEICDTCYEPNNWGIWEIRVFRRAQGELAETILRRAEEQIGGLNRRLDRELSEASYFNGRSFGYGDIVVFPFVNQAALNGFAPLVGSKLLTWLGQMRERDSIRKTTQAAADAWDAYEREVPKLLEAGAFARLYRDHRLEWMMRSGGSSIVLDGLAKGTIRFSNEMS